MRIAVIGCGYLGAVHAACMAEIGHDVVGLDVDEDRVSRLARGEAPFHEPGFPEILARGIAAGRLGFTTDPGWLADADLVERAGAVLAALRKVKSEAKTSQKTPILSVTLAVSPQIASAVEAVRADLTEAAKATGAFEVSTSRGDDGAGPVSVTAVELGQAPAKTPRR